MEALVVGIIAVYLHNKYYKVQLPQFLGFFGGSRFVPIITSFVAIFVGVFFFIVWPPIQQALISAGEQIVGAQKIFFAQLADPNHVSLYTEGTRFFAGRFPTMKFGLPAAAYTISHLGF